ncbi:hypothetical protein ACU686_17895 [Yinghuangia aomiensis]
MLLGGNLFRGALQLNKANQRMKEQVAEQVVEEPAAAPTSTCRTWATRSPSSSA